MPQFLDHFAHWTPRYAFDRARLFAYSALHPDAPWLAPGAARQLDAWLEPHHSCFEWGAGRSTIWFSRRVAQLTSIEHDARWYERVQQMRGASRLNNVDVRLVPVSDRYESEYIDAIRGFDDGSLDLVLVDGVSSLRDRCALAAIPKVRAGGLLVIDDIHRYLPSASRAPLALRPDATPLTREWAAAIDQLRTWEQTRHSSGVTDTGIWMRR